MKKSTHTHTIFQLIGMTRSNMVKRTMHMLTAMILVLTQSSFAQIAAWDFTGETALATSTAEIYTSMDASAVLTRGAGAAASAGGNSFRTVGFQNNGISTANTDYFQFTLSATPGNLLSLSTIDARFAGTAGYAVAPGVSSQFAYSLDGVTFTLIGSAQLTIGTPATLPQISLTGIPALQNVADGVTITLRYYASGQTGSGGWGFNSPSSGTNGLAIGGSITPASTPPTKLVITNISPASPVQNANFNVTVQAQDNSNVAQNVIANTDISLTLNTGSGALGGTLTGQITAGTNQVIISNVTYNTAEAGVSITATRTAGDILTAGNSASFTVTAGATPTILITGSLTPFLTAVSTQSTFQSYTVSGSDLGLNDIVITPPANFQIRKGVDAFANSVINLTPVAGTVSTTTIDVLYAPGVAGPHAGNITHTSGVAVPQDQPVSGATLAAEPTAASTLTFGSVTSSSAVVNFTGGVGIGARRIVVARLSSAVSFVPTDNTTPSGVSNDFSVAADQGSGNKIVYDGTGTTVTVNNLASGSTYHFAVYEYNGTSGVENYFATPGTGNTQLPGPITYTTIGSTYSQNFNSLPLAGTYLYTGLGTGPFFTSAAPINAASTGGWQHARIVGSTVDAKFAFDNGTANSGSTFSYGTAAAADRALGMLASGSNTNRIGAIIRNNTGSTLSYVNINYVGEQWRYGAGIVNTLTFGYQVGGTDISTGSFTSVSGLDFSSPVTSGGAGIRDGNLTANRTAKTATITLDSPWLDGTDLVIRWEDIDNSGSDDGLGIDDFSFSASAVAAPTQLAITSVNGGSNPTLNVPFGIVVSSVDNSNFPQNVLVNTDVSITLNTGTGALGGTLSGQILAGTSSVVISGITYNTAEAGVSLTATRTAGDVLTAGNSTTFTVLGAADHLEFVGFPATGGTNNNLNTFTVEARRADNSVDVNYTGNITLSIATGPGIISGTLTKTAVGGIASFNNIQLNLVGNYTLEANATGLTLATSSSIAISAAPYMTELVVPQYMGAKSDAVLNLNNTRTPVAVCVQFNNLTPNTAYDLKAGMALTSEGSSGYGAGNWWDGATFGQNNLQNAFTTDGAGNTGPVWVYLQPSGNASRFGGGQIHNVRIGVTVHLASMPANPQFIGAKTVTSLDVAAVPLTGTTADDGAYVTGNLAICAQGKHVLLYDNTAGTGNPLFSYLSRQAAVTPNASSELPTVVSDIWAQTGASVAGDFAALIPIGANNPAGVQRVETRNEDNTIYGASTDADGVWPSSANTTTVLSKAVVALTASDAPGINFALPTCVTVTANNTACPTNVTLSWPSSGPCDSYNVFFGTDNPPTDILNPLNVNGALFYNLPVLASNTPYFYQVVPYNVFGSAVGCSIGTFTTGSTFTVTPTQAPNSYTETFESVTPPSLPCGITVEDSNFPNDLQTWTTSAAAPLAGLNSIAIAKNVNNVTAKDDWFYSAPMNMVAGRLYRIYFNYRVSSAANPEQFEIFISNSADAATMTTTSAIVQRTGLVNTTYTLDSTADIIPVISGIYYYGVHANSSANQGTLYMDNVQVREIPVAALNPASCTTIPSLYDQLLVQPIYGAQDYKFKVENIASSYSYEFTRNLAIPDFRLKWAAGVVYDLTYDVSVSYKKNNVWSPYGASCPVTMGPFPTIQLRPGSCGAVLTDQYTQLFTDSVAGANDYEYKIVQNTLAYDHTWARGGSQVDYRMYWAYQSSPTLVDRVPFGFTYDVQVRALVGKTGPAQGNLPGVFGTFGPVCNVTLAGSPQTQLQPASCGALLANLSDPIYCIPVTGASDYQYEIVNVGIGFSATVNRNSSSNDYRLTWLPAATGGIRYATTYDVRVRAKVGGVFLSFGPICQVTTPASPLTQLQAPYCPFTLPTFSTSVYCNPVIGVTNYRYRITDVATSGAIYTKVRERNALSNDFKFSWTLVCCGGQNMLANTAYNVEVASYAGGVWSAYGPICTVTTGASVPRYSPFVSEDGLTENASALNLNVYPNPASVAETFAIELDGIQNTNETIQISIFSILGERVYRAEILTREESMMRITPEMVVPAGVYMIEAISNGRSFREKFVVK